MLALPLPTPVPLSIREVWRVRLPSASPFEGERALPVMGGRVFYGQGFDKQPSSCGALDVRTGRMLWRVDLPANGYADPSAEDGHLFVRCASTVWQLDPRDGRLVWRTPIGYGGIGPIVAGNRVVLETAAGRLEAFDLGTHRSVWKLERPAGYGHALYGAATCVAGGAFWAWGTDDRVVCVDLATGKVRFERTLSGGERPQMVPFGDAVALFGRGPTEAWRASDGALRWQTWHPALRQPFYAAAFRELWSVDGREGELYRFSASTGARIGPPVELAPGAINLAEVVRWAGGYAVTTPLGWAGFVAANPRAEGGAEDVLASLDGGVVTRSRVERVVPVAVPPTTMRRRLADPALTDAKVEMLQYLGAKAMPLVLVAARQEGREDRGALESWLLDHAQARDTAAMADLADWEGAFSASTEMYAEKWRAWMRTKADPDVLAARLLPWLHQGTEYKDPVLLVSLLARSGSPDAVAEVRRRLLDPTSPLAMKEAAYGWVASSGRPAALETVRTLRRQGSSPEWMGAAPSPPRTETERVLAAAFDARMRFWHPEGGPLSLVYGPSVRPFAVEGWAGSLRGVTVPRLAIGAAPVRVPTPWVRFAALDLDGTMVRFSAGGTEALVRVYTSTRPIENTDIEYRLRRYGRDWYVVSALWSDIGPFGSSRMVR